MGRRAGLTLSLMAMTSLAATGAAARKPPPPPTGEIVLDMDDPIVETRISGISYRLRVGLDQKDLVELNPEAAVRSGLAFEPGFDADVGRVTLRGIAATGELDMAGRKTPVLVSSHGRECCAGADGAISPALLPYALVRFVRKGVADRGEVRSFAMTGDDEHGLQLPVPIGGDFVYAAFALDRADSVASSSAGAILAKAHGGRMTGTSGATVAAFGVSRPTQTMTFSHTFSLAGFNFDRLPIRIADFAGHHALPMPPAEPGDIVVKRRYPQQAAWPVISIGRDRLDRCSEIIFATHTRALALRCDFAGTTP
ncbi:MAG: hypothetical protein JWR77_208 [Rhizorhabdus sp.]|nr:hypothetical protein [Rhizorhabdus sp.]